MFLITDFFQKSINLWTDFYHNTIVVHYTGRICDPIGKTRKLNSGILKLYYCQYVECRGALGMKNLSIADGRISASSHLDSNHAAAKGRLDFQGSWAAGKNADNQWLQIDLGNQHTTVTHVATQGGHADGAWVKTYNMQYSENGVRLQDYYEEGKSVIKVR